jgi:PAS domain S-box-containing protein
METRPLRARAALITAVLGLAAAGTVAAHTLAGDEMRRRPELADGLVLSASLLAIAAILYRLRFPGSWKSAKFIGLGVLAIATAGAVFFVLDAPGGDRTLGPSAWDLLFLLGAAAFLMPIKIEFADHFPKEDRREISADVALISAALGCIAYLSIRPPDGAGVAQMSSAIFALMAVTAFAAYGALALWVPSPAHLGQFAIVGALAASIVAFGNDWVNGAYVPGSTAVSLPLALGPLGLAILITIIPRRETSEPFARPARYGRPLLTTAAVAAACAALGVVANLAINHNVRAIQASALIGLLGAAVALRILVNQLRSVHATRDAAIALDQKEVALHETDKALARLQRANETLRESEERLRLVFEAAVDGIVELDDKDVIVRANEAFCQMIDLPRRMVEGQPWTALAAAIEADESLATLPATSQGTLRREGNAIYLESRISEIPGDPPRRLLLVRDVTAARVADQTIRSLFKFLQDRDEDRTRIMRRTNAAIESERNRIARDLHDGPVQGVSAASLSLEAVLLMLKAGELEEGTEILSKVRRELSEEADNLRRLMSGLRPPLLEERGLIPAIRETLAKFGRDADIQTEFVSNSNAEVPADLETLAYRIVQEALSNAGKHSKAGHVNVTVEGLAGQLRIEVSDDGIGFDSQQAREFLRMGRVGLASMRERVELANGTFMVHATPGKGTTVLATLPLDAVPAQRELAVNEA